MTRDQIKRLRQAAHREMLDSAKGVLEKDLALVNIQAKGIAKYINTLPQKGREARALQWSLVVSLLDGILGPEGGRG